MDATDIDSAEDSGGTWDRAIQFVLNLEYYPSGEVIEGHV